MQNIFQKTGNQALATLLFLLGATALQSQSFSIGNLPAGKTIIVTYEVDVNANACPNGTSPAANISNQSNVSGGNFSTVQTHETTPGSPDPTLTPFGGLTFGNLVYKDVNKDGDYDAGTDTPVNGVNLRLYLDDGDGVLDAGDGAHIATATTAGGGLYSFAVCPGNYIVEVIPSNFLSGGALYDNALSAGLLSSPVGGAPDPDDNVDNDDNGDPVSGFGVASAAITVAYSAEPDGADMNTNNRLDFGFKTPTTITINNVTLAEGTGAGPTAFNFTVTRSDTDQDFNLTVNTTGGTATSGTDFTAISGGTVSFTGTNTMAPVTVNVTHDNIVEANETFTVNLSGAPSGVIITDGTGDGSINNDDNATLTLAITGGGASQNEGSTFTFTATLNNPVQGGFQVAYTTNNGITDPATAGSDYTDNDGNLTFLGNTNEPQSWTVNTSNNNTVELDETISAVLGSISMTSAVQAAAISTSGSPQTATLLNDDAATVSIVADVLQSEVLTPMNFSLQLSNPVDANVTVQFSTTAGTATAGSDYTTITNQTVTFNANTTTTQVVGVTIAPDNIVEESETLTASIATLNASGRNVSIGASSRTGTINNDDHATVTLSPVGGVSQNEGNSIVTNFQFTATVDNPVQGGFMLGYSTMDGTATSPSDYTGGASTLSFNGTAGQALNIDIGVNGDLDIENNEAFTVQLGTVSGTSTVQAAAIGIAGSPKTGTILNDEKDWGDAPTAAQSGFANSYPTTAVQNGASHDLVPGGLRLGATIDGDLDGQPTATATGDGADEDGVTLPSSLIIGQTANITLNASATCKLDAWVDFNRDGDWADVGEKIITNTNLAAGNNPLSFSVPGGASVGTSFARFRVSTAGGLAATGNAADGEVEDYQVSILTNSYSISSPTVTEGDAGTVILTYTISRTDNTNAGSVDYAITGGTATSGTDYQVFAAGTANFGAMGLMSQDITVTVNGDLVVEDNETVIITLSNPVSGGIGTGTGTGVITNNDLATLTLTGGTILNEGNIGTVGFTFTATLNKAVQDGFKIAYTTTDGTATAGVDFTDNDGNLTFTGTIGETQSWTVDVNGDNTVELGETFEGALGAITMTSTVQAAAISVSGSPKTDIILNDDAATVSIAANVSQSEATTPQAFSVTLSNPVDVDVTVQFNTADNTATTGDNDYTGIVNQTVTFNAGTTTAQTVNVTVTNDNKVEANEIFDVSIGTLEASGRNVSLGTTARTGTITNNDATTVTLTPVGGVSLDEGNSGATNFVFTAELTNPVQGGFNLSYSTNNGTATTGDNDYMDNDGTVTFGDNSITPQNITVQVNGDNKVEADETFTVQLGSASGTTLNGSITIVITPQTGTIQNDEVDWGDAPDPLYATLNTNNGARHKTNVGVHLGAGIDGEDNGQPNANANGDGADEDGVTLPGALVINTTANITVNASTSGLLNAWVDFNLNGTWESPSEQIFTNTALVTGNNALSFAVPAGATLGTSYARFRFGNSNLAPTGQDNTGEVEDYKIEIVNTLFSIDNPTVTEGNSPGASNLTFRISRNVNANACSVEYTVTNGTATTADNDYQAGGTGIVIFSAGGVLFQDITIVAVIGDNKVELDETVIMTLSNPINASIASGMGTGTGTITNDDQGVITISSPTVTEGDASTVNATFNITLTNPSDANVSINHTTLDGTATLADNDMVNTLGTITIMAGSLSSSFSIPVNGDCKIEPTETFIGHLTSLDVMGRNIIFIGGGGTLDGTATITNDDALPVITCGGNVSQNAAAGQCSANVTLALPNISSLCGSSSLDYRHRPVNNANVPTGAFSAYIPNASNTQNFAVGRYEIEWRVTDGSGSSTCNLYLDVMDNQPPSIVCPPSFSKNTDFSQCSAVATYAAPTASDNCSATVLLTQGLVSGATFPKGMTLIEWKATDVAGLTAICQFTVTVVDNQPPSITCPANIVRGNDANQCSAGVIYATPTGTDNCSPAPNVSLVSPAGATSGSTFTKGTTLVQWKATDGANLTATCTFTVTVNDTQQPNINCPLNQTIGTIPGQCYAPASYAVGYSDNCPGGGVMIQSGLPSGANFPKGQTTLIWRATDAAGLTKTCSFRITVNDTENPVIVCPSSQAVNTSPGACSATVNYTAPTASDNCAPLPAVVRIGGPATGSSFPAGTTQVTWRAIDGANRSSTCSFLVTVTDNQTPSITCPGNQSVTAPVGQCSAMLFYANPTAVDNCGVNSVFLLIGLASGSIFPQGATTNTWRAVDNNGLSATCTFTVTVACGTGAQTSEARGSTTFEQLSSSSNLDLRLAPNPAVTEVLISVENLGETGGDLTVFDATGHAIWQTASVANGQQLTADLSRFAAGLYFVTLRSEGRVATKRLLVQR